MPVKNDVGKHSLAPCKSKVWFTRAHEPPLPGAKQSSKKENSEETQKGKSMQLNNLKEHKK